MNFDATQFGSRRAADASLTVAGCVLFLLEAFGRRPQRAYLMPLTLASLAVALVLELSAVARRARRRRRRSTACSALDRFGIVFNCIFLVGAALTALLAPAYMREHDFEFGEFYSLLTVRHRRHDDPRAGDRPRHHLPRHRDDVDRASTC